MAKPRQTIARDSVFRSTGVAPSAAQQGIGSAVSPTRQTAVWLADDEVEWLDSRCHDIKRDGWRNVTRSAFIRALIRSAMEQSPDLSGVSGEQELVERLAAPR